MALFNDDYNKTARTIGKVVLILDNLLNTYPMYFLLTTYKQDLIYLAYICKLGILDRIENNNWDIGKPIAIPTGLFSVNKITLKIGLEITIGKLAEIASLDLELEEQMTEIFNRGNLYYQIKNELPDNFKSIMK